MQVSTEAKLFAVRQKLLEAERSIYECNKILAFIGEGTGAVAEATCSEPAGDSFNHGDPITGLYPGQKPDQTLVCEEEEESLECLE